MNGLASYHDLLYEIPPRNWEDGFPIGNGHFGGMVWQPEGPDKIVFGLTKLDVWDYRYEDPPVVPFERYRKLLETDPEKAVGEVYDEQEYGAPYPCPKPCGRLSIGIDEGFLPLNATLFSQMQRLSLDRGVVECDYEISTKAVRVSGFVATGQNLLAVRVENMWTHDRFTSDHTQQITLEREIDELLGMPETGVENGIPYIRYVFPGGFEYVLVLLIDGVVCDSPKVFPERVVCTVTHPRMSDGPVYDLFVSAATSLETDNPLEKAIEIARAAQADGYVSLERVHRKWWQTFWQASGVEIQDRFLEGLWYFSLYQLASTCGGTTAPGLFGLWNMSKSPQWHGDYHGDYNISMAHWYVFSCNHVELGDPLFSTFSKLLPKAKELTQRYYQIDGAKFPIATAPIIGIEITRKYYRMMIITSAYYVIPFWWRYVYTLDQEFLRNIAFAIIEESSKFYLSLATETQDGVIIGPSWAPEQGELPAYNVTNDLSLIKVVWQAYVQACRVLNRRTDYTDQAEHYLANYPDYPEKNGRFLDSLSADEHLLMAHTGLFSMVYPGGDIDADHALAQVAEKTIETYFERAQRKSFVGRTSISDVQAWTTQALGMARLRKPERADHYLMDVGLSEYLKPNGMLSIISNGVFDTREKKRAAYDFGDQKRAHHVLIACANTRRGRDKHFQFLEGPSALLCILNEMMLQSHNGVVRVFPALPERIKNCSFVSLRAEGGFLVSARSRDGKTETVEIESLAEAPCTVRLFRWAEDRDVKITCGGSEIDYKMSSSDTFYFDTAPGNTYVVCAGGSAEPVTLTPPDDGLSIRVFEDCWGENVYYGKPRDYR